MHTNACWMKPCVSFSYFRVGVLAEQGAELAQASGTLTCSDTPGPALFLFLASLLFVQQTWTETVLTLTFLNVQHPKHTYEWGSSPLVQNFQTVERDEFRFRNVLFLKSPTKDVIVFYRQMCHTWLMTFMHLHAPSILHGNHVKWSLWNKFKFCLVS